MESVTIPHEVYESLKAECTVGTATHMLAMLIRARDAVAHPGDGYGRVLAEIWNRDHDETVLFLADLLAELRVHHPLAGQVQPEVSLDELLGGLRFCLPSGFGEHDRLATYTRDHIHSYYASA
ncbi:hypothetical protein [Prauserella endophytica]|uniref:CdiI immunity protein domain-containing protein n=1 Tax=Prauserella endophytica TaxID=1592324 RepID=A0ABY2RV10_9PSEU|nr:hypothetical protein [Prauserella endophytica]TKG61550.1 hypothetical protein FCN18_33465 [Prauserella endophytica]